MDINIVCAKAVLPCSVLEFCFDSLAPRQRNKLAFRDFVFEKLRFAFLFPLVGDMNVNFLVHIMNVDTKELPRFMADRIS